jgi:hypothetical protein
VYTREGEQVSWTGLVVDRLVRPHSRLAPEVLALTLQTADGEHVVTATPEHPFWVPSRAEWVHLQDLEPGADLLTATGVDATVLRLERVVGEREVFNFEVEGVHSTVVAAGERDGVVVHNACGSTGGSGFIVHPNCTAVHRSQAEMVDSITGAGATKIGNASRTTEGGQILRMDTPNAPMDVRVMDGQPGGGVNQGPRTVTTRAGTNQGVHPDGSQVKAPGRRGGAAKAEIQEAMHTHGQVNDR